MEDRFTWIPFYKELADKLSEWEDRQKELIDFIEKLRENNYTVTPLLDKDEQGNRFLFTEIDPFTVFGVFNRQIGEKERFGILHEFKKKFNVESEFPGDLSGIPILNNKASWFFSYQYKRTKEDIPRLWSVFKIALIDDRDDLELGKAIDEAFRIRGIKINLTMGLFWIRPEDFLSLDGTNRDFLKIKLPSGGLNSKFYFDVMEKVKAKNISIPELSYRAYQAKEKENLLKDNLPEPEENNYWLVGAYWDGEDQTERFMEEGIWQNGYEDKFSDEVKSMKPGDKIAIKSSTTQKLNLPFDSGGETVSKMIIKARGTIVANQDDGRTVEVEWDDDFKEKDWYFYTSRTTVWRLQLSDDYDKLEYSRKLVDFIWKNESQDYEWFLGRREKGELVKDEVEESDSGKLYSVDDIVKAGVFLKREEVEGIVDKLRTKKNIILQGAPGVGKTFLAQKLAYALIERENDDFIEMVQFHQSYSYEDFVRGFRPNPDDGRRFDLRDAVFYNFCQKASGDPENQYVFIIDEINRGNISQIFGELLMLIEKDKRNKRYAIPLMYSRTEDERFHVPSNVYIIGLMNLADRSLALVDYALRRRFSFITLEPKFRSERYAAWLRDRGMKENIIKLIVKRMNDLNREISDDNLLGENFQIGHSYFCPAMHDFSHIDFEWYEDIINTEIVPLLKEYWFDDPERVEELKKDLLA